jgi:hypothetical protein
MKRFRLSGGSNIPADTGLPSRHLTTVASALQHAMKHLFDPYQPELHYMRGPGPKWRERHAGDRTPFARAPILGTATV